MPGDETSDYGEAPSDDISEDESSDDDDDDHSEVDTSSRAKAGTETKRGSDADDSGDCASSATKAKKEKKQKGKARPQTLRKYTKISRSPDVYEEALASRIA